MVLLLLDAIACVEQPLSQLPGIGTEESRVQAVPVLVQREERGTQKASVVGHVRAVVEGQVDELCVWSCRHELVVTQPPVIVGGVGRQVSAQRQRIARKKI